ncbi:MAG: dihydroorotate dehydrogenase electron transfer subunit [Bacteroidales bacterium]|jgi:dihydroorotate dehydrogenase electron transfer subunit|nr:dihydroorotate dehydrogenase electron transfer subunit [Bacteroidales bacterium]
MKRVQDFKFKDYKWLNYQNYILTLKTSDSIAEIKPGNFAELKIPNAPDVFLRRPLSILDVDHVKNTISFYVKIIGKGTEKLGKLRGGDKVSVIYPLGNSFSVNGTKKALLVGGGSGIAPFILLGRELKQKGIDITFLIGARTKEDVLLTDEFKKLGEVLVTTEDGTMGQTGLVTHHSVFTEAFLFDKIYTCGPDPMMKAIAKIAEEKGVDCEASLENMMACGFGACLCCVVETNGGNKCVCTEGPVFNTKELAW